MNPIGREEFIFHQALTIGEAERAVYIDRVCGEDKGLRRRINVLLEGHFKGKGFLDSLPNPSSTAIKEGPGSVIGNYQLIEQIGEGGFGIVYKAEQKSPIKRLVALKILKLGMDTRQVIARFEAERQALAMMDHPNIARVYDGSATEAGRPYFVMEWVNGESITQYCNRMRLSTFDKLLLFMDVCAALHHAHQKGIIHRDIKPSNILITDCEGAGVAKVIDFGIAKATEQELTEKTIYTQLRQFIGTPAYMSPEQAERSGIDIDTRSDIYSLGVVLYELLTGQPPFDTSELLRSGFDEMRRIISCREPVKPSTRIRQVMFDSSSSPPFRPVLTPELDWIVMKALEKDRNRRYESAHDFKLDLQRLLANEPVQAVAPSLPYKARKFIQRNRRSVAFAISIAVILILSSFLTSVLAWRMHYALQQSERLKKEADQARASEFNQKQIAIAHAEQAKLRQYVSDMKTAQILIDEGNLQAARSLLRQHVPAKDSDPDLRDFVWQYLNAISRGRHAFALDGHQGAVTAIAFSPDGSLLASGEATGSPTKIHLWDVTQRERIQVFSFGFVVNHLEFSGDGNWIYVNGVPHGLTMNSTSNSTLFLRRNQNSGLFTEHTEIELPNNQSHAVFIPGSNSLVYAAFALNHMTLRVFDLDKNLVLNEFALDPVPGSTEWIYLKIDRAESINRIAVVWKTMHRTECQLYFMNSSGLELIEKLKLDVDYADQFTFLASGDEVLFHGIGSDPLVWNWKLKEQRLPLEVMPARFYEMKYAPDKSIVSSGGVDHAVRLWNSEATELKGIFLGHMSEVMSLAWSPDGKWLASGSWDTRILFWNPHEPVGPKRIPVRLSAMKPRIQAFGDRFLIALVDQKIGVYNLKTDRLTILESAGGLVDIDPDGRRLFTAGISKTNPGVCHLETRDSESGQRLDSESIDLDLHESGINIRENMPFWIGVEHCLRESWWAVLDLEGAVHLFDRDGTPLRSLTTGTGPMNWGDIHVSQSGRWLALFHQPKDVGVNRKILLWDLTHDNPSEEPLILGEDEHVHQVVTGCFSPDESIFIEGGGDGWINVWGLPNGNLIHRLRGHRMGVMGLSLSPDSRNLASCSHDGTVRLWHVDTGRELCAIKVGDSLRKIAFSSDGKTLAVTGGPDLFDQRWIQLIQAGDQDI